MHATVMTKVLDELSAKYPGEEQKATKDAFATTIRMGKDHDATVQKFGRYPYRNEVLGRTSTPEELEYLKTAKTYGQ